MSPPFYLTTHRLYDASKSVVSHLDDRLTLFGLNPLDTGYISTRPAHINTLSKYLKTAVESCPNLNTLVFAPKKHHEALFTSVLPLLPQLGCLRSLTVNVSCADEKHVPALVQLRNLESLTIQSPTRALLQSLPQWLEELQSTLRDFRLTVSHLPSIRLLLLSPISCSKAADRSLRGSCAPSCPISITHLR